MVEMFSTAMRGIFKLALILIWCSARQARAAKRVDAKLRLQHMLETRQRRDADMMPHLQRREETTLPVGALDEMTSLGEDTQLEVTKTTTTVQGTKLVRMQEKFKGHVVSDAVVTLETDRSDQHVLDASGAYYRHIEQDTDGSGSMPWSEALSFCLRYNNDEWREEDDISHTKTEQEIFIDANGHAYPGFFVQYLVLVEGEERRPTCIVDARNRSVVESWDSLEYCRDCEASGTGGNLKIGKIQYGRLQRCLDVTRIGDICYLENQYVRVVNNNFTYVEKNMTGLEVASYNCHEIDDDVNGAYSPLLDAFFYGTVVVRMYEDWYGMRPVKDKLLLRVHYGVKEDNALWNGYEVQIGDGSTFFYPLASLDVVGHEVAHAITEENSGLYYYQQWGGLDEAFCDMAGETAQAYLEAADWVVGIDITKSSAPLRYLDNPTADQSSIAHIDNFTDYMDPHDSSGVYNRVFYLLVHEYGLPIREVFHVFLHANQMYWHHLTDFVSGACDVMKAAYDRGQDGRLFRRAFSEVGIEVCDTDSHVLGLRNNMTYTDITVSKDIQPTFYFRFPREVADGVHVVASSSQGKVIIALSNKTWGADEGFVKMSAEDDTGVTWVKYDFATSMSSHLTIQLKTDGEKPLTDVQLVVWFHCLLELSEEQVNHPAFANAWIANCLDQYLAAEKEKEKEEGSGNVEIEKE